ncbi:hypothetical protein J2Z44_003452 [Clostridium punense]|uniref:Uncharacterized protein n=1 Tax=Clostridium punense TaxID=1054297 RepID=A0ABS4K754_9CLOT|nr:hypothetical protein M918_13020 [Clostridium sp. BL8]MBP2023613.1 hypothetical protein [Clostridium punense]
MCNNKTKKPTPKKVTDRVLTLLYLIYLYKILLLILGSD